MDSRQTRQTVAFAREGGLRHEIEESQQAGISTFANHLVVVLAPIWLAWPACCAADESTPNKARSLLEACLAMQSRTDRISMRITTDRDIAETGDGFPREQRAESWIRRDDDRFDVAQSYLFPGTSTFRNRQHRWRAVTTRASGVMYHAGIETVPPARGIVDDDWPAWFTSYGVANETRGGPLDGYFMSTGSHRAAELMANSPNLRLRGNDSIGGNSCQVVEAATRYGKFAIWIAESIGSLPLKVTCEIGPGDLREYEDTRPFAEYSIVAPDGRKLFGSTCSGILEDVQVEKIGDTFIPVAGKFTRTEWYSDLRLLAVNSYQRTAIELSPSFEGSDAFLIDLPEGSRLTNLADRTSGVMYEWRGGRAVAGATDFRGHPAVGSWEKHSAISQLLGATLGIVLLGAGIGLVLYAQQPCDTAAARQTQFP